jgi:hypothetical protein
MKISKLAFFTIGFHKNLKLNLCGSEYYWDEMKLNPCRSEYYWDES